MWFLLSVILWPLGAVLIHFSFPLLLPGEKPPSVDLLALIAFLGMGACLFAGALRALGFLRDDRKRRDYVGKDDP